MYLLLTDETNAKPTSGAKFFVYGGLIVGMDILPQLNEKIVTIRGKYGYKPGDTLKFDTRARPTHVTPEKATAAKNEIIQTCIDLKCKFIAYVVLHEIAKRQDLTKTIEWGANSVIGKFNIFLKDNNTHGIVAIDRLPAGKDYSYISDKFSFGLKVDKKEDVTLDRIILFTSTCINASNASSAMDVSLGSFRYCINQSCNVKAASAMMRNICKMIWCIREGNKLNPFEKGLIFRPKDIQKEPYKEEYKNLIERINQLLARE